MEPLPFFLDDIDIGRKLQICYEDDKVKSFKYRWYNAVVVDVLISGRNGKIYKERNYTDTILENLQVLNRSVHVKLMVTEIDLTNNSIRFDRQPEPKKDERYNWFRLCDEKYNRITPAGWRYVGADLKKNTI